MPKLSKLKLTYLTYPVFGRKTPVVAKVEGAESQVVRYRGIDRGRVGAGKHDFIRRIFFTFRGFSMKLLCHQFRLESQMGL